MSEDELDGLMAKLAATPTRLRRADLTGARQRFEVRRRLGSGSFGDVYEARDRESGSIVALKALKSSRPDWLYRFKREFRTVADLSHPNVIRMYELFAQQEQWFLTMELVDGLPFDDHIARAPEQLLSCFGQLAAAIKALHDADCVHCDIKPSNALVERSGRVVLLDFGLARPQNQEFQSAVAGTPHYMAPERGMGDAPTESSDWYSFGVMLYEALTGKPAFAGSDQQLVGIKFAGLPPCKPEARPEADERLCDLATRLVSPTAEDRPGADEILDLLAPQGLVGKSSQVATADSTPFVGRERELKVLEEALARTAAGTVLLTLSGHPGIGKSSLVRVFGEQARRSGATVYQGRCHEFEGVPYKGIDGAIDKLCSDLHARPHDEVAALVPEEAFALPIMFPVLRRVRAFTGSAPVGQQDLSPRELRRTAAKGLGLLLERMATSHPVVVFIDDLQWATDDGVRLLVDLLTPPSPPILVIVSFASDARGRSAPLDRFLEETAAFGLDRGELTVPPLGNDDVAAMLQQRGKDTVGVDELVRATGGDPYLLNRALSTDLRRVPTADDLAEGFRSQINDLDRQERLLLEMVSIASVPLTQSAACLAGGLPAWIPQIVDRLRREKLVRSLGQGRDAMIEPYHERVRQSAISGLSDLHIAALHLRLAEFLEKHARVDGVVLAHHFRCAGARDKAREWTQQAAREATSALAFSRVADLYRNAFELAEHAEERIALLVELSDALEKAGRRADAGRVCLEAADLVSAQPPSAERPRGMTAIELRARAGEHLLLSGHFADGIEFVREALETVSVVLPGSIAEAVAETINFTSAIATRGIDFVARDAESVDPTLLRRLDLELTTARALAFTDVRAQWVSARALADALEAGEPVRVQRALSHFVFANAARAPDHELVVLAVDAAQELAERSRDDVGLAFACLAKGMLHVQRMEHHTAIRILREAAQRFASSGRHMSREVAIARCLVGLVCGNYGVDLRMALSLRERCAEDAEDREDLFVGNWVRMLGTWLDLSVDDIDAASANHAAALAAWPNVEDDLFVATALMHEVAIELYARPETAWEHVQVLEKKFLGLFTSLIPVPRAMFYRNWAFAAVLAYQQGKATRAETLARIAKCAQILAPMPYIQSLQAVISAHSAAVRGDRTAVIDALSFAAETWDDGDQRGPAMAAELRCAQISGDTSEEEESARRLANFGVGDPDRFARLFIGPRFELSMR